MSRQFTIKLSMVCVGLVSIGIVFGYFLAKTTLSLSMVFLSVGGIVACVVGGTLWLIDRMLVPIREAKNVAKELVSVYGPKEQVWETGDELDELRRTLAHLSMHLRTRMQALEGERAKVTTILDSMVEGVMALDALGRIVVTNPSARRILDLADEQIETRPLLEVVRNRELADLVEWCQSLTSSERCGREVVLTVPHRRVLEVNAMPLTLVDQQRGLVLVLHDITELRRLEQVRAEFVANVSHELRTPLTAIKGYLETLLDEPSPDPITYRRFLGVAHTHADRLGRLVNDLMNLSDIEMGKIRLNQERLPLMEVVNEVSGIYEQEAVKKGILLVNQVPEDVHVYADRDRVSQIILNLIDNALKYTSSNGQITFAIKATDGNANYVMLQIHDTGQGIPPADLPRITERFYRVDKARSREEGGTGLGLAIVKHLVHLHNGNIQIESELGKGTTVEVVLPVRMLPLT